MKPSEIRADQERYWGEKLRLHGATPEGVGSESVEHKQLRYGQIAAIFQGERGISVHEIGAGLGDFYAYLSSNCGPQQIAYSGSEITADYCDIARARHPSITLYCRDVLEVVPSESYDYVVLSGVFHQKGNARHVDWIRFMQALVRCAFGMARKGVSFNVLSSYADFYNPANFYADLAELQTFVVRDLSRFFSINHSGPLFEATVQVFRPEYVKQRYPHPAFEKYLRTTS